MMVGFTILLLVLLIGLGLPVAVALFLLGWLLVFFTLGDYGQANRLLAFTIDQSLRNYFLSVIPLFVLMGEVFSRSGVVNDLFHVLVRWLGRIPSGIPLSVVFGNAVFAAATGVSVVSASLFGRVAAPVMIRSGILPEVATGLIAGSSILGMLIPPSILMIVYGLLTDQPIGKLFIAGLVPGLLVVMAYSIYILAKGKRLFAATLPFSEATMTLARPERSLGILGLLISIVMVLGGIYSGLFTVVEAAAVGATLAVLTGLISGRLGPGRLLEALVSSVVTTASIGIIFLAASFYSKAIALVGLPGNIQKWFSMINLEPWLIVLLICGIIFLLGFVLDTVSTLTIVIPVVYPVLTALGVDLIWFGILVILAAEMGLITPPVGLSVYALKAALPKEADVPLETIFRGAVPFLLLLVFVFGVVFAFPQILRY